MLHQSVDSIMAKVAGKPKLQNALIVEFVWQIFVLVELVRHFSFPDEQQAVNHIASQLVKK